MIQRHSILNMTKFIAFITLALSTQIIFAKTGKNDKEAITWYQVEVLLFKNNKEYKQDKSDITLNIPSPEEQYVLIKSDPMLSSQLKRLPSSSLTLNKSFTAITRSKDFEVLEFAGWKQPLIKNKTGIPLTIRAGKQFGEHHEIEGQLTFRKNRYLHVKADIYMANYEKMTNISIQKWLLNDDFSTHSFSSITNNSIPETITETITETTTSTPEKNSTKLETDVFFAINEKEINYIASNIAHMNESRRMRSGEIHFLDHPKFGILITVEPTDPPFVYSEP